MTSLHSKFLAIFRLDKTFWFKSTPNNIDHVLRFKGAWHPLPVIIHLVLCGQNHSYQLMAPLNSTIRGLEIWYQTAPIIGSSDKIMQA